MTKLKVLTQAIYVVLLLGCATASQAQLIVGHRGASHDAPENTLAAFRLAFEQKADGIEGDFWLTKDGHIACIHDADTLRVAGKKLLVSQTTLADLKKLDVGSWKGKQWKDERVPTLQEVFGLLPEGKILFIELKCGPEIVKPLTKVLANLSIKPEAYVVISFNEKTLAECKKQIPKVTTHWLTSYTKTKRNKTWRPVPADVFKALKQTNADGLGSQAKTTVFNAQSIERLREMGMKDFHVWTVDDVQTAKFYKRLGAFGITTNRPGYLRKALEKTGAFESKKPTKKEVKSPRD